MLSLLPVKFKSNYLLMGGVALPSCKLLGLRPPSPGVYGPYGLYGLYDRVNGELLDVQAGF